MAIFNVSTYVNAITRFLNPVTNSYQEVLTPTVFKKVLIIPASGTSVTLWTPATGKSFQILHVFWQITGEATLGTAGDLSIDLYDNTTDMNIGFTTYVPSNPVTSSFGDVSDSIDLHGNGYPSIAVNNPLIVKLSQALTAGTVRVAVEGCEL